MLKKFKYNGENKNIFMIDEPVRKKLVSLKKLDFTPNTLYSWEKVVPTDPGHETTRGKKGKK